MFRAVSEAARCDSPLLEDRRNDYLVARVRPDGKRLVILGDDSISAHPQTIDSTKMVWQR